MSNTFVSISGVFKFLLKAVDKMKIMKVSYPRPSPIQAYE